MTDKDTKLYERIDDADEDLTDSEKREIYQSEIEAEKAEREWEENQ